MKQGTYINLDGNTIGFNYTNTLTLRQKVNFVVDVANTVISNTLGYAYIIEDAILDYYIIKYFTNIKLFEQEKDFDLDILEKFLKENRESVIDTVTNAIPLPDFNELLKACKRSIELRMACYINNTLDKQLGNESMEEE